MGHMGIFTPYIFVASGDPFRGIIMGALQFYNDEHDMLDIQIKKPCKPRRRKHDTNEQYQLRTAEWEASLPHDVEIKSKGNSMTQVYFG